MELHKTIFKDTRPGEKVLLIVRKHWFILLRDFVGIFFLFIIPFFLLPLFANTFFQGGAGATASSLGLFFGSLWALIMWNLLFVRWTDYYYDLWVLTDLRIIDVDQNGLFHRDVATILDLNHIQDVKTVLSGVIGNLLNYGEIQVQTAGSRDELVMEDIANPSQIERVLREARHILHEEELSKMGGHKSEI